MNVTPIIVAGVIINSVAVLRIINLYKLITESIIIFITTIEYLSKISKIIIVLRSQARIIIILR